MRLIPAVTFSFFWLVLACTAQAHNPGEGYVYLIVTDSELRGRVEMTLSDIHKAVPLHDGGSRKPTEAEFRSNHARVVEYLGENLDFFVGDLRYPPVFTDSDVMPTNIGDFARMRFELPGLGAPPGEITAEYSVLFNDAQPDYRGMILIESNTRAGIDANESQFSAIFGPGRERQTISLDKIPWQNVFGSFVRHGVWHIWIGFDHVLFLVALLLPSVMVYRASGWAPTETFRESLFYVVKVVTLFTLAHTVTLSLAALDIIRLPVSLVEAVIALSIAAVAVNNIRPFLSSYSWLLVFIFGLFHGLGFANVLAPLGGGGGNRVSALLGFNIGVEIGQLVIILAVFPLLYVLRNWVGYRRIVMHAGSAALIAISSFWFVERTVDVPFLSSDTFKFAAAPRPDLESREASQG